MLECMLPGKAGSQTTLSEPGETVLVRALEVSQGPHSLQAVIQVILQSVCGAVPYPHRAILRSCAVTQHIQGSLAVPKQLGAITA